LGVQLGNCEGKRYGEGKADSEQETGALKGHIDLLEICGAMVFYDENSSVILLLLTDRQRSAPGPPAVSQKVIAPVSGEVNKTVVVGLNVEPGQQLLTVVPLDEVWITANFKET